MDTRSSFFEDQKNRFLTAIYEENGPGAEAVYNRVIGAAAQKVPYLTETEEKYLRQIQVAFKRFSSFLTAHASPEIHKNHAILQSLIRETVKEQSENLKIVNYQAWETHMGLDSWQKELLFHTAITFQMSSGCSNYCRRCNEWALPKLRAHFSHGAVKTILTLLAEQGNIDLALYGATDPLDWEVPPHTLDDILLDPNLPVSGQKTDYSLLTKLPRGKENLLKRLVQKGISLSVSLTNRNKARIKILETQLGQAFSKQHATADLLIPAGLDEDFSSVKPSITDGYGAEITPEGAFIVIPTFTSALYPFGHKKLPITGDTQVFPVKKLGRGALLVDYFKPLEVIGKNKALFFLDRLLDVQVENILLDNGSDELTPPGMRSVKEYFDIFDELARHQRKKMTRSVITRIKKRFFSSGGYGALSPDEKKAYREKIQAHLDFCRKKKVALARRSAISFFLAAICDYLDRQPVTRPMLAFLIKEQSLKKSKEYEFLTREPTATELFSLPDTNIWALFRFYATALVRGSHRKQVGAFIAQWPARYDPVSDLFIPLAPG